MVLRINIILFAIILLTGCATRTKTTTTTTEKIDTLITLPPSIYTNVVPFHDIIKQPYIIENERASVKIQYDTIRELIAVDTYVKPDTVQVVKYKTTTTTEKKRTPLKLKRWRWFVFGAVSTLFIICLIKFRATFTHLMRP